MVGYDIQERFYKSFIQLFHGIFPELKNVSINEISQDDIIEIPIEKARSKKYENFYMFWEDNEGNLVALTKENRVKALFYSYGKCYKVNKDYKCQDIKGLIEDCDNDVYEAAKLYVEEAFKIEKEFTWGKVIDIHCIGEYQIVEYIDKRDKKTYYHGYINYSDTNHSYLSLDSALIGCIGYKHEGGNGKAAMYFEKMIGLE